MMNLQKTIVSIFPGCTLTRSASKDGIYEIGGITGAMVPQNCDVLASGVFQYVSNERSCRTYLVKADGQLLVVRILPDASKHLCAQIMKRRSGGLGWVGQGNKYSRCAA
jgi:hypothetical protein